MVFINGDFHKYLYSQYNYLPATILANKNKTFKSLIYIIQRLVSGCVHLYLSQIFRFLLSTSHPETYHARLNIVTIGTFCSHQFPEENEQFYESSRFTNEIGLIEGPI